MTSLMLLKSMLFAQALQKKPKKETTKKKNTKTKMLDKKVPSETTEMCRICDQETGDIPIFNNIIQPNIPEDIKNFGGVVIDNSDSLSKYMCKNCLDLLNGCIMFKEICQKTNKKLQGLAIKEELNPEITNIKTCLEYEVNSEEDEYVEEETDITCDYCHKPYLDWVSVELHLKKCKKKNGTEEVTKPPEEIKRKFLCDVCGKTAHSNANLLAHMTTHEAIFPFKCDECPYMGRTMDLLKVHKRSHLSVKPFKCPQCNKGSTTASNLAKHVRHVHSTERAFKCNYCDKAFSFQHDMKRHIRDIHLRQGTVECDLCFKKFNTRKILRGHQWKVHKIKGERQGRIPAYLQWQMEVQMEGQAEQNDNHNVIEGETGSIFLT